MTWQYFLILCLATRVRPETTKDDESVFGEYVKVNGIDTDRFTKIVTISGCPEPSCILFTPDDPEDNVVHDFYAAVSCDSARWTMNKIFAFLKRSPLYYQKGFEDHRVYKKTFGRKFINSVKSLAEIDPYLERFINVLHNFAKNYPVYAYYSDTTLIKSLVSLRLKIHFASSRRTIDWGKFGMPKLSDGRVVRLFAEELNALQSFLSTNCSPQSSDGTGRYSEFIGYWITEIDDGSTALDTIDGLLFSIRPFKLESDGSDMCFVTQILLENFASPSLEDPLSLDMVRARVQIPGLKVIPIINILLRLTEVYDIDLLFLYQNFIITAIVKLLFYRTLNVVKWNPKSEKILRLVEDINLKLSTNIEDFPELLVDCFRILHEIVTLKRQLDKTHDAFIESLLIVEIDIGEPPALIADDDLIEFLAQNEYDLGNFLTKINENTDDFKCFHRLNVIQHIGYEIYYNKFEEIITLHFIEPPVIDRIFDLCGFTLKIYSICYQAVIYINRCIEEQEPLQKINLFQRVMKEFNKVRSYVLTVIRMKKSDFILRKIAFKVAILMYKILFNYDQIYYVERIFNVAMSELNTFGTKYCETSNYINLLINNNDLIDLGNVHSIDEFMINYFKKSDSSYDTNWISNHVSSDTFKHIDIDDFYTTIVLKSQVLEMYEENIFFFWKGRMLSVKQIFKNATSFILNYYDFKALYDIYFKFYIAVVFYETREILTEKLKKIEAKFLEIKNELSSFNNQFFPAYLYGLIADIHDLWEVPLTQNNSGRRRNTNLNINDLLITSRENIERQFTKFRIEFRNYKTSPITLKYVNELFSLPKKRWKIINVELRLDRYDVFSRYKLFILMRDPSIYT